MITAHYFEDANKRTAWTITLDFVFGVRVLWISRARFETIHFKTHRITAEKFDEQFIFVVTSLDYIVDLNRFHTLSLLGCYVILLVVYDTHAFCRDTLYSAVSCSQNNGRLHSSSEIARLRSRL